MKQLSLKEKKSANPTVPLEAMRAQKKKIQNKTAQFSYAGKANRRKER